MKIILNGASQTTQAATLSELLAEIELAEAVVATALNGEFVALTERDTTQLSAGDQVEIVAPMQGG
jgi:sulfur carrier protein